MKINERMELSIDDIQEAFNNLADSHPSLESVINSSMDLIVDAIESCPLDIPREELAQAYADFFSNKITFEELQAKFRISDFRV